VARAEEKAIGVVVDGLPLAFPDVTPQIVADRLLVPFRIFLQSLGAEVQWDGSTQTVQAMAGQVRLRLRIGDQTAYINDQPVSLAVPPQLLHDRTMVPLRFVAEALDYRVKWDENTYTAFVSSPARALEVLAFYALGDSRTSSWTDLFGRPFPETSAGHTDLVRRLAVGWYSLDRTGALLTASATGWRRPEGWEEVLTAAARYQLQVEMVVHMADGRGELSALLQDESAMSRAAGAIAHEARLFYHGVNLDLEGLGFQESGAQLKKTQERFNHLVELVAKALREKGKGLTLTLHAPNSVYLGYDYEALGKLADRIVVMAYDYGPKPEPLELVQAALEKAKESIPADKLFLGISAPSENPASIKGKIGLARRLNLKGIALWRLGIIPAELWQSLQEELAPALNAPGAMVNPGAR